MSKYNRHPYPYSPYMISTTDNCSSCNMTHHVNFLLLILLNSRLLSRITCRNNLHQSAIGAKKLRTLPYYQMSERNGAWAAVQSTEEPSGKLIYSGEQYSNIPFQGPWPPKLIQIYALLRHPNFCQSPCCRYHYFSKSQGSMFRRTTLFGVR